MGNVHWIFITYIHRTLESRNTKNSDDFFVQVRNFLLPLSLKSLRHKERYTHSFYSGFSICPPPYLVRRPQRANSSGLCEPRKSTLLIRCLVLNWRLFQISKNPQRAFPVHDVINILPACSSTSVLKFAPN